MLNNVKLAIYWSKTIKSFISSGQKNVKIRRHVTLQGNISGTNYFVLAAEATMKLTTRKNDYHSQIPLTQFNKTYSFSSMCLRISSPK
jgi:hypothetical protein